MSPKGGTGRSKREREKAKREARLQPPRRELTPEHTLRVGRAKDGHQHEPGRGETAP